MKTKLIELYQLASIPHFQVEMKRKPGTKSAYPCKVAKERKIALRMSVTAYPNAYNAHCYPLAVVLFLVNQFAKVGMQYHTP